ncbi:hypothetical protein EDD86DRAFT_277686 [Gorgonomyces haynaldii]|nr:hypothetical protein EDD86DRAFT_277686 [Gorgonomyces haynaldii]
MSFITVKYGAGEEKILNPNCLSAVLLGYAKKTCGFENIPENVDLASESGEVIDLVSKPKEYAKKYVEPRTSYILVKCVGDDSEDSSLNYVPLLDQVGDKIKFAVTNPTARVRRGKQVKVEKQEQKPGQVKQPQVEVKVNVPQQQPKPQKKPGK